MMFHRGGWEGEGGKDEREREIGKEDAEAKNNETNDNEVQCFYFEMLTSFAHSQTFASKKYFEVTRLVEWHGDGGGAATGGVIRE